VLQLLESEFWPVLQEMSLGLEELEYDAQPGTHAFNETEN
jgi:hypothetical protein